MNLTFLFISIISVRVSTYMARYCNKDPPNLSPPDPTEQVVRMPTEREIRLSNWRISSMGGGEARNRKELGMASGKGKVKDNLVSEGDWQHLIVLQYLLE